MRKCESSSEARRRFVLPQDYGSNKCLLSLNQLRKFSHSIARRTAASELARASRPVRVSFAMQSAYFSYPRDFVGTTRQVRRRLVVRGHADFRAILGKARESTELHLNLRNPEAPGGLGSSLAPAIRSHVAIPSHRETNRFLSFLRGGLPRLSLPSLSYPSLFIVPLRISAFSAVLSIALFPCDSAVPVRSAKFFSAVPLPCSRCDSCRDLAHYAKK